MVALIFLLLFSANLITASQSPAQAKPSAIKKVLVEGVTVTAFTTAHVVAGPIIYPQIKAAVVAVADKTFQVVGYPIVVTAAAVVAAYPYVVAAAPYVNYAHAGYRGAKQIKKSFYPSREQQVEQLRIENTLERPFEEQLREASVKK